MTKIPADVLDAALRRHPWSTPAELARHMGNAKRDTIGSRLSKWAAYGLVERRWEVNPEGNRSPPHRVVRYHAKDR